MKDITFRPLNESEIEVRPTDTKYKGKATLLLYQTARCPMQILDSTCGAFGWQKKYEAIGGEIYCCIGIQHPETGEWIWKSDCGSESNVEAAKGQASDAFKRAAATWGIGRELYSTPRIQITCPDSYYYNDRMTMTFKVKSISWDDKKRCIGLEIMDKFGKVVYTYKEGEEAAPVKRIDFTATKDNVTILKDFCHDLKQDESVNQDELLKFFQFYEKRMGSWKNVVQPETLWKRWSATSFC